MNEKGSLIANLFHSFTPMRVHALKTLKLFWTKYPDAEPNLRNWYSKIEGRTYTTPQEVLIQFKGADYVGNERIIFNIARNKYRLVAAFNYDYQICFIKFVGTHKDYDRIDPKTIEYNARN